MRSNQGTISAAQTEDTLNKLYCRCIDYNASYNDRRAYWVLDAVQWYIRTGRASCDFIRALSRKNKRGLDSMIAACLAGDCSTLGIIQTVNRILKIKPGA